MATGAESGGHTLCKRRAARRTSSWDDASSLAHGRWSLAKGAERRKAEKVSGSMGDNGRILRWKKKRKKSSDWGPAVCQALDGMEKATGVRVMARPGMHADWNGSLQADMSGEKGSALPLQLSRVVLDTAVKAKAGESKGAGGTGLNDWGRAEEGRQRRG